MSKGGFVYGDGAEQAGGRRPRGGYANAAATPAVVGWGAVGGGPRGGGAPQVVRAPVVVTRLGARTTGPVTRILTTPGADENGRRWNTGGNKQHGDLGSRAAALDRDNESVKVVRISHEVSQEIRSQRTQKGWKQEDLARAIVERKELVAEYERGEAIPNEGVLLKMERALGVHLRGKQKGEPLPVRGARGAAAGDDAPRPAPKPAAKPAARVNITIS